MHPLDEPAQKLELALQHHDLDGVVTLLPRLGSRTQVTTSNLKTVFEQAGKDGVDLLHPPTDFHAWLHAPLRRTIHGENTASPRTVHTRATLLARLYRLLEEEGLIQSEPLRHLPRPDARRKQAALDDRAAITRLHAQTKKDLPLFTALLLIDRAAFSTGEVLELLWQDVVFPKREVFRRRTASQLAPEVMQALDALVGPAGGPIHAEGKVFPQYKTEYLFRHALWKACEAANVPYLSPTQLRQAGLRDHGPVLSHTDAGFSNEKAYEIALKLSEQLRNSEDELSP